LRGNLGAHEVFTVRYQGWSGLKNGDLLRVAEDCGFEVFLSGDQTMPYEQNLGNRRIAVIVLSAIEWHIIRNALLKIRTAIDAAVPGSHQAIDCGSFDRKRPRV